jgi:acid phosphatase (class A)
MRLPTVVAAALALASCAALPGDDDDRYLHPRAFDARDHLPPPPKEGTPAERRDREIFRATRPLKDGPRWSLAQADADKSRILDGYACALGVSITPQTNPKLAAMMEKMRGDVRAAVAGPKWKHLRPRPYLFEDAPICLPKTVGLAVSPDYPSGHSTWGWTVGLLLAEAAPDRAPALLARAQGFGESRVVCGVHNMSSVEAGRRNARNLHKALKSSRAFKADLAAVRAEMTAVRRTAPAPDKLRCEAESALVARPLL